MKSVLLLFLLFIASCDGFFYQDPYFPDEAFELWSINPDGTQDEMIILLELYIDNLKSSKNGNYIVAYEKSHRLQLIDITSKEIIFTDNDIRREPSFSNDSQILIYIKNNNIMKYNISESFLDSISLSETNRFPIFSLSDDFIIFSETVENQRDYTISLKRINSDGSNPITLYSCSSYHNFSISYPTISTIGEIYFIVNGNLHKINIDGSDYHSYVGLGSERFSISPNNETVLGSSGRKVIYISTDGMDTYELFRGEEPCFIDNNTFVYTYDYDLLIGFLNGTSSYNLTNGQNSVYCNFTDKIYYMK